VLVEEKTTRHTGRAPDSGTNHWAPAGDRPEERSTPGADCTAGEGSLLLVSHPGTPRTQ
jgi:hypothetical protein